MILEPEGRMNERIVLGNRTDFEPDSIKTVQIAQGGILCDIIIIVPNEAAPQRGKIGNDGYYQEEEIRENGMSNDCLPGAGFALRLRLSAHDLWGGYKSGSAKRRIS